MLSKEENEYLCHTGPGTPMGNLLRRYWIPALLSSEVPEPNCPPIRVRLLSEDLIAFRDSQGRVGLLAANCPHRGASLFFGRNEEEGLRCVYHGWKFDTSGSCVDMPSEPPESNFKDKIHATAYPTAECAGLVWTYMGPREKMTPFRETVASSLPAEGWYATRTPVYCNYIQSMEGNIDSSHISFLHRNLADYVTLVDDGTDRPGYPSPALSTWIRASSKSARLEIQDTEYGFRYAGLRTTAAGHQHVRMTVYVMPTTTYIPDPSPTRRVDVGLIIIPADDNSCWRFSSRFRGNPFDTVTLDEQGRRLRTADNDYLLDREAQRATSMTGISGVANQDYAVTESMGPIYDRTKEHLGTTDLAVIHARQMLIRAAQNLEQGIEPPGLDPVIPFSRFVAEERILPAGADWRRLATDDDPEFRPADLGARVS